MAINPALLVSAAMLQDYLVDNVTAQAMAGGVITCYQDNSRTTLKNWYYQTGTPGNYTYITLPNPLTLSAAGTIVDVNGNDTIPFYYPYSELDNSTFQAYYITVVDANGQDQFVRANFPYIAQSSSPTNTVATLDNVITNNEFWRNIGTLNATTLTTNPFSGLLSAKLAPSQHDGFSMPDLQYIKSTNGATETITFNKFPLDTPQLTGDITPEFYINHNCTALQAGETYKYYQFPISLHLATLQNVAASVTIQAMNNGGTNNQISISILPFYGTGVASPVAVVEQPLVLNSAWTKYTVPFVFPNIPSTATLGNGGDDAYYLQIGMPISATCNINFCKPSVYLSNTVPTNDFATYDQIDAVINTPRTGDVRTSLNDFYYFGWVPVNNGTIGNAASNGTARANADTWPLYNLIWQKFKAYTNGTANSLAQMVTSAGSAVAYGATAIADFNANNAIALSQLMGRVVLGTVPAPVQINGYSTTFTASNNGGNLLITTGNNVNYFNGMPVYVTTTGTLPDSLAANTVYYVANFSNTNLFNLSTTFANAIAGTVIAYGTTSGANSSIVAAPTNSQEGQYAHVQLEAELATHSHNGSTIPFINTANVAGAGGISLPKTGGNTAVNIAPDGNNVAFNVTQPGVFMNMFMKL